jgi:hypothetical protein
MSIISSACFLARSLFAEITSALFTNLFAVAALYQWLESLVFTVVCLSEDDAVWDDEKGDAEDAEEPVDNEFETDSEAEDDE